ncbi:MAG: threonine aldolase, partial [Bdellovibrionales bacterium]|nr:threonine aldolase [Bdellovibrionales bacterium]
QPGLISITQPTELGTVYSLAELGEIGEFAQKHNLRVHVDGARLTNSIVALKCQFSDLKDALNPDAISFGGTKNGLLGVEAVLLFDKHAANQFKYIRKQNMQLPSKTRFLASQFSAYFEGDLHLEIAIHSHGMAAKLAKALEPFSQINVLYPVESNAVFATIPKEWTKRLREAMHFYVWDEKQWSIRLMCSFDTTEEHIEHFVATATSLAKGEPL